ncbi:hypothetical protein K9O30_16935 [Clostridium bowmanii]|nr:hypothetical protein [Clostridium bowmanii]MBU3191051.1 hypothetical protein [Clostridium bowmanii]MCA1075375.1 hypothetical protein [Clostridium bowmanii]
MVKYEYKFKDCYVMLEINELKVGNNSIERIWNVEGDKLLQVKKNRPYY